MPKRGPTLPERVVDVVRPAMSDAVLAREFGQPGLALEDSSAVPEDGGNDGPADARAEVLAGKRMVRTLPGRRAQRPEPLGGGLGADQGGSPSLRIVSENPFSELGRDLGVAVPAGRCGQFGNDGVLSVGGLAPSGPPVSKSRHE